MGLENGQYGVRAVYRLMLVIALLVAANVQAQQTLPQYRPPEIRENSETQAATRAIGSRITLLAPDHRGQVTDPALPLWWHATGRIEVLDVQLWQGKTLLWQQRLERVAPGLHRIALPRAAAQLKVGDDYVWRLRLAGEQGGAVAEVNSALRYIGPTGATDLAGLASQGIWYDAIDLVSKKIERNPKHVQLRRQRASLLRQVGLGSLAQEDELYMPLELRASLPARRFTSGESLWVTMSCAKPCYMRIIQVDAQGKRQQLVPNSLQQGSLLPPGELVRFPAPNSAVRLTVSPPFGREVLEVTAADKPFPYASQEAHSERGSNKLSTQYEQLRLEYETTP